MDAVIPPLSQQWIYGQDTSRSPTKPVVEYFSLTTPVGSANVCGRMVFSDVHVSQGGGTNAAVPFPTRCGAISTDLTPQQKALEFMLFDLSSCAQIETGTPQPPPVPPPGIDPAAARHDAASAGPATAAAATAAARSRVAAAPSAVMSTRRTSRAAARLP